jgi:hypothetical protein
MSQSKAERPKPMVASPDGRCDMYENSRSGEEFHRMSRPNDFVPAGGLAARPRDRV